jgi:hypothetical protein
MPEPKYHRVLFSMWDFEAEPRLESILHSHLRNIASAALAQTDI